MDIFNRILQRDQLAHMRELIPPREASLAERLQHWATHNPELPGLLIMDLVEASRRLNPGELFNSLRECSDDLAAWVEDYYAETKGKHPSEVRRYERDMEPVRKARALLARLSGEA